MAFARYFLIRSGNTWLVTLEGVVMAACPSRTEAIESAVVMADLMGSMHHDTDVMVDGGPDGPLEVVWTYGVDRRPRARSRKSATPAAQERHVRHVQVGEAHRGAQ